jgi:hypothetical protein
VFQNETLRVTMAALQRVLALLSAHLQVEELPELVCEYAAGTSLTLSHCRHKHWPRGDNVVFLSSTAANYCCSGTSLSCVPAGGACVVGCPTTAMGPKRS